MSVFFEKIYRDAVAENPELAMFPKAEIVETIQSVWNEIGYVVMAPLSTPESGRQEYAEQEVRGILYYVYVANNATKQPFPVDM